ncbi:MAG TPA: hypothetical protein VK851_14630 [Anaerolineales bacterium]|nr:hypothetical protein [Anaerolineales bacterium]
MDTRKNLLFGAFIGAVTGIIAASLLNRRAQQTGSEVSLTSGDGMKLGMLVFGLLRAVAGLGDEK